MLALHTDQPSALLSPHIFAEVFSHIYTLKVLQNLGNTCKTFNTALKSAACNDQWMAAAKMICGSRFWTTKPIPGQPHADDKRYTAQLRIAPWLSKPVKIELDFCRRSENAEAMQCHVYSFNALKTAADVGCKLKVWRTGYGTAEGNEDFHTITTNPRPFGLKFVVEHPYIAEEILMSEEETDLLAQIKALNIPSASLEGRTFDRVTRIHDSAVAAQLNSSDPKQSIKLLIFGTKPLRLLCHIKKPFKILEDGAYNFGLGEMWTTGFEDAADESTLYYYGPRRDQATVQLRDHGRCATAFWAEDVNSAVKILREHKQPLTTKCPISGHTLLHYAAAANNAEKVKRLVRHYKIPIDTLNAYGFAPINIAAFHGLHTMTHLLESLGAKGCSLSYGAWKWPREDDDLKMLQSLVTDDDDMHMLRALINEGNQVALQP